MRRKFEKAIVLAAGMGKRLEGETRNLPKALVEVRGHSLLELVLGNLSSFTGARSVVVATGHFHELVEEKIDCEYAGLKIDYLVNEDYESTNNCYTLWLLRHHLADGFLLVNTDVLFDGRILKKAEESSYESFIVVDMLRTLDEEDMKVRLEDSRIVDISKELDPVLSHGEYIGILGFGPRTSGELIRELERTVEEEGETGIYYEDVVRRMLDRCSIHAVGSDPYEWIEIDTLADLKAARESVYSRIAGALGWK